MSSSVRPQTLQVFYLASAGSYPARRRFDRIPASPPLHLPALDRGERKTANVLDAENE